MERVIVSVIVPVYNSEGYLKTTIDSILNQTFKNFELILVDDGSTDKSGIICDKYTVVDERVIVIHKKNGGVSDARNLGMEYARGKFIEFVDNDDYVFPDFLQTMVAEIGEYDLLQSTPLNGLRDEIEVTRREVLDKTKTLTCNFINNTNSQGPKYNYIAELDYIQLMGNIYLKILKFDFIQNRV